MPNSEGDCDKKPPSNEESSKEDKGDKDKNSTSTGARRPSSNENTTKSPHKVAKKSNHGSADFVDLLDDNCLCLVVRYSAESAKMLASLRTLNQRLKKTVDFALYWREEGKTCTTNSDHGGGDKGIIRDILVANGHGHIVAWADYVYLESLAFYEAVVAEGLFEKKKVAYHDVRIPKSVSRVLKLYSIMDKFPKVKEEWESPGSGNNWNVMTCIIEGMLQDGILPPLSPVDWNEHIKIHMSRKRKYLTHPIYNEYRSKMPLEAEGVNYFYSALPIHLKLLLAARNKRRRR